MPNPNEVAPTAAGTWRLHTREPTNNEDLGWALGKQGASKGGQQFNMYGSRSSQVKTFYIFSFTPHGNSQGWTQTQSTTPNQPSQDCCYCSQQQQQQQQQQQLGH